MVSDYCRGGELFFHLKRRRTFSENLVQFYSAELVSLLFFLSSLLPKHSRLENPENVPFNLVCGRHRRCSTFTTSI